MTKAPGKHPFNLLAYRHAVVPTIHTTYDRHHHQPPIMLVTLWPVRERTVLARPSFASRLALSCISPRWYSLSLFSSYSYAFYDANFLRSRYFCHNERNGLDFATLTATSCQIIGEIPKEFALSIVLKFARDRECTTTGVSTTGRSTACTHTSRRVTHHLYNCNDRRQSLRVSRDAIFKWDSISLKSLRSYTASAWPSSKNRVSSFIKSLQICIAVMIDVKEKMIDEIYFASEKSPNLTRWTIFGSFSACVFLCAYH